ncbi:hypothetical protein EDB89DRAFT_1489661 [Lactarius sanguifluus]|nr:hypothetical protein EDB89DRAFT_1489661 [Lactarius sanguifluus]
MRSHSDHSLQSDRASPIRTHAPCKNIDSREITQSHQKERAKMRLRSQCAMTIDTLTDNILLEIFDLIGSSRPFYEVHFYPVWNWHTLVHVCRRWRQIIFASPHPLDLQLLCTQGTPVKKDLGLWPPTFPIAIDYGYFSEKGLTSDDEDNIIAALEQRDRIHFLRLSGTNAVLEKMATFMQGPFPKLRRLAISSDGPNAPVLPDDFLGGSAPSLREIRFNGIPFPALPALLSSAGNVVELLLHEIPLQTGYISSAAFVACLATLPSLECLSFAFHMPASDTDRVHPPPETRGVLRSLTSFIFNGHSTYLEAIMARIDTPQLKSINIAYIERLDFHVTELSKFVERSAIKPSRFGHGEISFIDDDIWFYFSRKIDPDEPTIAIQIPSCEGRHDQIFTMAQVLNRSSAMLSDVVRLNITINDDPSSNWQLENDDIDDVEWLELFRPFTAVKKLDIYEELAEIITHAFQSQAAGAKVLPALKFICVDDHQASNDDEELDSRLDSDNSE